MELNPHVGSSGGAFDIALVPGHYQREALPSIASSATVAGRTTLVTASTAVVIGSSMVQIAAQEVILGEAASWDSTATDYTAPANRAGKDFYVYATAGGLVISANATVPTGYTADNCRQVAGFHCLCLAAGDITDHPLSGFLAGDILPASIWDLAFRPTCSPAGMVYSDQAEAWVDIYLQSGTGATTASAYGATITDTRVWMDHVDDLAAIGKRLLWDGEFQIIAEGSNQKTNIVGSADPVTTGGHVDTAGRRMISNIGCEDCCGAMNQWLLDQSYRNDEASYLGTWSWYTLPGNKGSLYRQGGAGDVKLVAGGPWATGSHCGSRSRAAYSYRWAAASTVGARGCARRHAGVA